MAVDAALATVADGAREIVDIDREAGRHKLISRLINHLILNLLRVVSADPFHRGSQGWGMILHKNHAAKEANGSIMVGMFVCCVFASQKPSERELFVPARTDLAVILF